MFQVVSFDPGGTTGWAVFEVHDVAMWSADYPITANVSWWAAGEYGGRLDDQADQMVELCSHWETAEVVSERFTLRKFLPEPSVLDPVRLNAKLQYAIRPRRVWPQDPSLAMTTVTDDRLRDMGYYSHEYLVGKPHARDAVRHALTWMRRRKEDFREHGVGWTPGQA